MDRTCTIGRQRSRGKVFSLRFFHGSPSPGRPNSSRITAKYGEEPDMFSAQYYDAVMILAKAMTDSNSTDPKVFKNELAKLKDYKGVSEHHHRP